MWLGELTHAQGYLLGSLSQIMKAAKMRSWEEREGPSEGTAARARALRRDSDKALKDKEILDRLRRKRKAHQRGALCQGRYFTR